MKYSLCLAWSFSMWMPPSALAQIDRNATIAGRITTSSHLPVAAAIIKVTNSSNSSVREATSDSNGVFLLRSVPLGAASLSIRAEGFEDVSKQIDVAAGMSLELSFATAGEKATSAATAAKLQSRSEYVQVTATLESRPSDVTIRPGGLPSIVNTVTQEQIEHTNVGRDTGDLLNRVPGVVIASLNQGNIGTGLKVRGFFTRSHGAEVSTHIDGAPQNVPSAAVQGNGVNDMSWIIPELIDRIEVVKGPFSPLAGDENRAASLFITTKDASATRATVSYGRFNTTRETAVVSRTLGAVHSLIAADFFKTDGYRDHSGEIRGSLFAKETVRLGGSVWGLRGYYQGSNWDAPGFLSLSALQSGAAKPTDRDKSSPPLFGDANRTNLTLTKNPAEGENGLYLTGYLERYNRRRALGINLTTVNVESDARWISGGRAMESYTWKERFGLAAGVDLRNDYGTMKNPQFVNGIGNGNYGFNDHINLFSYGFFAQGQVKLLPNLKLTAGMRTDEVHFDITNLKLPASSVAYRKPVTTPRAGLAWTPLPQITAFFNFGQGFRVPDQSEISPAGATGPLGAAGGGAITNFSPPKITSYDYGVRLYLSPRWTASGAGFYTLNKSEISQISAYVFLPIGDATRIGWEAETAFQATNNLNFYASITSTTTARVNNPINGAGPLLSVPRYVPKTGAGYLVALPKGKLALNLDSFYYSDLPYYSGSPLALHYSKPFARYDLRGSYYVGHLEYYASAILQPYKFSSEAQFGSAGGISLDPRPKWDWTAGTRYRF